MLVLGFFFVSPPFFLEGFVCIGGRGVLNPPATIIRVHPPFPPAPSDFKGSAFTAKLMTFI